MEASLIGRHYLPAEQLRACIRESVRPGLNSSLKIFFVYLWLCWVFIAVYGLSLVNGEWGLLFIAVAGSFLTTGPSGKTRD